MRSTLLNGSIIRRVSLGVSRTQNQQIVPSRYATTAVCLASPSLPGTTSTIYTTSSTDSSSCNGYDCIDHGQRQFSSTTQTSGVVGGLEIQKLKDIYPHMDVVRYTHKNYVMNLSRIDYYAEALAIGILGNGITQGDVILSWLPSHFQEQMILQFACSKAGLVLYTLDPMLAVTDPEGAKKALKAALTLTNANIFISQEAGNDVNYIRLAERVIPELRIFDYTSGEAFITPRFPHLRFCINTGFDYEGKWGWLLIKHMVVPSNNLDEYVPAGAITGSTPLAGGFVYDDKGIPIKLAKTLTNDEVIAKNIWPTYTKILKKEFHVVEGVGVIF